MHTHTHTHTHTCTQLKFHILFTFSSFLADYPHWFSRCQAKFCSPPAFQFCNFKEINFIKCLSELRGIIKLTCKASVSLISVTGRCTLKQMDINGPALKIHFYKKNEQNKQNKKPENKQTNKEEEPTYNKLQLRRVYRPGPVYNWPAVPSELMM